MLLDKISKRIGGRSRPSFCAMKKIKDLLYKTYLAGYTAGYKAAVKELERIRADLLQRAGLEKSQDSIPEKNNIL